MKIQNKTSITLHDLDLLSKDIPWTGRNHCHLLFNLVSQYKHPEVIEISCCYGKATLYLAAAAKLTKGFLRTIDLKPFKWKGKSAKDLLKKADLLDVCEFTFFEDARWYLINLFKNETGEWVDLAFIDASHTVEIDSFIALALWTHLRPGGLLVFDDLDWIPQIHGEDGINYSKPKLSHVNEIYDYISSLPKVSNKIKYQIAKTEWTWGFIQKHSTKGAVKPLQDILLSFDKQFR